MEKCLDNGIIGDRIGVGNRFDITKNRTKGVTHKCLFGRFFTSFLLLFGATILVQNRPVKGIIGYKSVSVCYHNTRNQTKGVVHKPLFGRFSTPFSALSGAGISIQNRLVKGGNRWFQSILTQLPPQLHYCTIIIIVSINGNSQYIVI